MLFFPYINTCTVGFRYCTSMCLFPDGSVQVTGNVVCIYCILFAAVVLCCYFTMLLLFIFMYKKVDIA